MSEDYLGVDQSKVFFICKSCDFVFEADPNFMPILCPQCGSEDTDRT
jgi:predicted Zn-ribbon and HTH transcriptional regulator